MRILTKNLILILLIFLASCAGTQKNVSTGSRRASNLFEKAREAYQSGDFQKAIRTAEKAIQSDSSFSEAYLLAAEINLTRNRPKKSLSFLQKLLSLDSSGYPIAYRWLGDIYYNHQHYQKAISFYQKYLEFKPDSDIRKKLQLSTYRLEVSRETDSLNIRNIGAGVNSVNCEFVNAITLDNSEIYYTVKPENTPNKRFETTKRDEDFFYSVKENGKWKNPRPVGEQINSGYNEGAMHLSPDGTFLYFTSCGRARGYGSCDLYYAERLNDTSWKKSYNLGPTINTRYWETQPCFAADGKTMYFVSNRPGGKGGADIWKSVKTDKNKWSEPVNSGTRINTPGEEMAPYLHPDGETLYFSSDGHKGMGGSDLFMSRKKSDSTWTEPQNLGAPINNSGDQINIIVDAKGTTAYISSKDSSSLGCYDIYSFPLPKKFRPNRVSYLKGYVYDAKTKKPLKATFELVDFENEETVVASESKEESGSFMVALPTGKEYALHVNREGYMFYSEHFSFIKKEAKARQKDIPLQPIQLNASEQLNNIFFAFDSDSLIPKSRSELERLLKFMKQNRGLEIEIQGHTDSIGSASYNKELSKRRAERVFEYLAGHSVPEHRMTIKGYGEEQPIAPNDTEEGRARNRRTEIKITGILKY